MKVFEHQFQYLKHLVLRRVITSKAIKQQKSKRTNVNANYSKRMS